MRGWVHFKYYYLKVKETTLLHFSAELISLPDSCCLTRVLSTVHQNPHGGVPLPRLSLGRASLMLQRLLGIGILVDFLCVCGGSFRSVFYVASQLCLHKCQCAHKLGCGVLSGSWQMSLTTWQFYLDDLKKALPPRWRCRERSGTGTEGKNPFDTPSVKLNTAGLPHSRVWNPCLQRANSKEPENLQMWGCVCAGGGVGEGSALDSIPVGTKGWLCNNYYQINTYR